MSGAVEHHINTTRTTEQDRIQFVNEPVILLGIHHAFVLTGKAEENTSSVTLSRKIKEQLDTHVATLKEIVNVGDANFHYLSDRMGVHEQPSASDLTERINITKTEYNSCQQELEETTDKLVAEKKVTRPCLQSYGHGPV